MATWNTDVSVRKIESTVYCGYGRGKCANHVREAIEAGGIHLVRPVSNDAKDYGPSLQIAGFSSKSQLMGGYKNGDVVVFPAIPGHPSGHIAIYDSGKGKWVSDHVQDSIYANRAYNSPGVPFTVYRFGQ